MKQIHTTSATMNYLIHIEKSTLKEIRIIIGESLLRTEELLKGKRQFTKQNYTDIITKYPDLEGKVEYFENVKLKDK